MSHDFSIIEAVAGQLPARVIKQLENDKDVVGISYDDDVSASGISSSVTGTPLATPQGRAEDIFACILVLDVAAGVVVRF